MSFSEDKESKDRSADLDSKLFLETCLKIGKVFDQMLSAKKTSTKKSQGKINEMNSLKNEFSMHYLTLKKLNRLDKYRTKNSREVTQGSRQKVDSFHLQLQNLLYEVLYLEKEVTKCLQFKSGDEDIPLIPVEQFYKEAPEEISRPSETRSNAHLLHLARLEFEKIQRQLQAESIKSKDSEKDEVETRLNQKREQLAKLGPQLKAILASTKPLQEFLDLPMDEERDLMETSRYLPHALFVLFSEINAYAKVFDSDIEVSILGSVDEAKASLRAKKSKVEAVVEPEEDNQMEADEEEEKSKKKKRGGNQSSSATNESVNKENEKIKQLLEVHPLSVQVIMKVTKQGAKIGTIQLNFKYLTFLEVATVQIKLDIEKDGSGVAADKEILQALNIFAHLTEEPDSGETIPNPTYLYKIQKLGLDEIPRDHLKAVGSPYLWVQDLAGLHFPQNPVDVEATDDSSPKVDSAICQSKVSLTMNEIRERFLARLALQRQLTFLEKAKLMSLELPVPDELRSNFPPKINSKLRAWGHVDLEQYMALSVSQHLKEGGAVSNNDSFYRLQINRDFPGSSPASLIGIVAIKPNYPRDIPVFCLNLHWNGEHNARNSERIRELERAVNTRFLQMSYDAQTIPEVANKGHHFEILSLQLQHLMSSLDVLLDSWAFDLSQQDTAKATVQRENLYLQPVRGRRRQPPLQYHSDMQMYSQ